MEIKNGRKPLLLIVGVVCWIMQFIGVPMVLAEQEEAEVFVQLGHSGSVNSVVFSPDGRYLASHDDKTIKLWDTATGLEIYTLEGHSSNVNSVAFSPDGRYLASGGWDKIKLWDAVTGKEVHTLLGHPAQSVVFSPDGRYLASGSLGNNSTIKLWDVATGQENRTMAGHSKGVFSVVFSPDGRYVVSGSADKTIKLWDAATGREIHTFEGHSFQVISVVFSPDGRYLASGSNGETIKLWDVRTGREIRTLGKHSRGAQSFVFSPDSRYLASGGTEKTIILWDVATGQEIRTLEGHSESEGYSGSVLSVVFSPDGRYLASGSNDATVKLWDTATWQEIRTLRGYSESVFSVAFNPDGRYLASGSGDATIKLWDATTGQKIRALRGHPYSVRSVVFSPDGRYLASGSSDATIKIWDVAIGGEIRSLMGHSYLVESVAFSPDGRYLASGSEDNTIKLWDAATGREIRTLKRYSGSVRSVVFSPDGRYLASGSGDNTINLWDATTGKEIRTMWGARNVASLVFSPDSRYLVSASGDATIKLWDVTTGRKIRTLEGHSAWLLSVAFSPDSRYLVSASGDKTIKLWNVVTGEEIRTLKGHSNFVNSVAFSPDGRYLVSGSKDSTTKVWSVEDGKELVTLVGFDDGEWVAITPEGYFNSSERGADYLNVRIGLNVYGIGNFWDVFFRPDIVKAKLAGKDITPMIGDITLEKVLQSPPPEIKITELPESNASKKLTINYEIASNGGGIGEVNVFQNGKLIYSDGKFESDNSESYVSPQADEQAVTRAIDKNYRGIERTDKKKPATQLVVRTARAKTCDPCKGSIDITPIAGEENIITVSAKNKDGTITSFPATVKFKSTLEKPEPHLWVLSVGINKYADLSKNAQLINARKDAEDFIRSYQEKSKTLFKPENIHIETLLDESATKQGILARLERIKDKAKPSDTFVWFIAGHGMLDGNSVYNIIPTDARCMGKGADPCTRMEGLLSSNDVLESSRKIMAMKQLLILDTCHSGGLNENLSGLYDARMSSLARNMGLHLYASASSTEQALDGIPGTNGLFTAGLLDSMKDKARDDNEDKYISIKELGKYTKTQVSTELESRNINQTPVMMHFGRDAELYRAY